MARNRKAPAGLVRPLHVGTAALLGLFVLAGATSAGSALAQTTERVSVATGGAQATGTSFTGAISADGRFVAFYSDAINLVSGDTNAAFDVFVHDRQTGTTERVSVATGGVQAIGGDSYAPSISADGRFVAFYSLATNLVSGDTNAAFDVFVHDRQTGTTERVSVATGGAEANNTSLYPVISADGRFVAFWSDATNLVSGDTNAAYDVFVHDRQTGTTERVSVATGGGQATGGSYSPSISADGRFVAFYSLATNLVGSDTNGKADVFVHDRQTGTTERVSVATNGAQATGGDSANPAISADGRFVAFESDATNLIGGDGNGFRDIFVRDRGTSGPPPLAPLALNATDVGADAFTANWTGQDATAAGYRIDVATSSSFSSAGAAADGRPAALVPGYESKVILCIPNPCTPGTVSQVVSGVQPADQEYYYRVQAWGRGGDSAFSDTVVANPPPSTHGTALNPLVLAALGLVAALGLLGKARRRQSGQQSGAPG